MLTLREHGWYGLYKTLYEKHSRSPYGRLAVLLNQSLAVHNIKGHYDVSVLDCSNGELQFTEPDHLVSSRQVAFNATNLFVCHPNQLLTRDFILTAR